jgi:hypothetical protein
MNFEEGEGIQFNLYALTDILGPPLADSNLPFPFYFLSLNMIMSV